MATDIRKAAARSKKLTADVTRDFDAEGVRRAVLAVLETVYEHFPHITLPQLLIALEVLVAELDGQPHTLVSLVNKLDMPFSTASRVVWSLTKEGGDIGYIKYERHPTDRRKKFLVIDPSGYNRAIPRAMVRAMLEYYGPTVQKLRRAG
jgi:DNA-binding MarR family transcriptional regulator